MSKKGPEGFESYYSAIYGSRWLDLKEHLSKKARQVARINSFADQNQISERARAYERGLLASVPVVKLPEGETLQPQADASGLLDFYNMDAASLLPPIALGSGSADEVLDMCAAPGGKSLILSELLAGVIPLRDSKGQSELHGGNGSSVSEFAGRLVSNELSDKRRARLRAVFDDYLPKQLRDKIVVTKHDGTRWCLYEKDAFDKILLDAPCSGERHLLANADEMSQWSQARTKNLAVRQYALLASALAVVRPGGRIVYSTCSLSPLEDDDVISRLLKKRKGEARVVKTEFEIGEPTEHGWVVLPDKAEGFGPIYLAVIERE